MSGASRALAFAQAVGADVKAVLSRFSRNGMSAAEYNTMLPFFASLANRRFESVSIGMLGDSLTQGYRLSSYLETQPAQLRQALRDRFPVPGVTGGPGFIGVPTEVVNSGSFWPVTLAGGTTVIPSSASPSNYTFRLDAAGEKVTYNIGPLTSFEILFNKTISGAASGCYYKIDGGTAVNFDTNNTSTVASKLVVSSPVVSTIEIGYNAGTRTDIAGIRGYNGDETKGVQVHNFGASGATSGNFAASAATVGSWAYYMAPSIFDLDLLIIGIGGNDKLTSVSVATFKANLTSMISSIRTRGYTKPIVITACYDFAGAGPAWSLYIAAMQEIVAADATLLFVDHSLRMYQANSTSDPQGLYLAAYLPHESAKGAALMVETLVAALSPR